MFNVGGSEMIVLGILALLVFGPESLPGIIKNVMRTINAVKAAARDFQTEVNTALQQENERKDLAQRQRKPFVEETEQPALAEEVPPEPTEAETGETEPPQQETETPASAPAEAEEATKEATEEVTEESAEEVAEEPASPAVDDDDGPRVPMRRPRPKVVEEVTETT